MFNKAGLISIVAGCLVLLNSVVPVFALDRGLDLNLAVQEEYNDNIFWNVRDPMEDYITTISGGLTLYRKSENVDLDIKGKTQSLHYRDNNDLNALDQFYSGSLDYRFSQRWQAGVDAGFSRDSRPDRDIPITGEVLTAAKRDRVHSGMDTTYTLTENTSGTIFYQYEDVKWDQATYSDMVAHQAGLRTNHNLGSYFDNTYFQMDLNYNHYQFDISKIALYTATIGLNRNINELWYWSFSGGARYQDTEFDIYGQTVENDDKWGGVGSLGINYHGEYARFGLSGSHGVTPSSNRDGTTERTSFHLKLQYRIGQKSRVGLSADYILNQAKAGDLATEDMDETTLQVSPFIRLSLIGDLYLVGRYTNSHIEDRTAETKTDRQMATIELAYDWSIWK